MARRTFDVIDISEILIHWHAGRSQNQISASLGVDRRTVRKYTAAAIAAGIRPGGPPVPEARWAELAGCADSWTTRPLFGAVWVAYWPGSGKPRAAPATVALPGR